MKGNASNTKIVSGVIDEPNHEGQGGGKTSEQQRRN